MSLHDVRTALGQLPSAAVLEAFHQAITRYRTHCLGPITNILDQVDELLCKERPGRMEQLMAPEGTEYSPEALHLFRLRELCREAELYRRDYASPVQELVDGLPQLHQALAVLVAEAPAFDNEIVPQSPRPTADDAPDTYTVLRRPLTPDRFCLLDISDHHRNELDAMFASAAAALPPIRTGADWQDVACDYGLPLLRYILDQPTPEERYRALLALVQWVLMLLSPRRSRRKPVK